MVLLDGSWWCGGNRQRGIGRYLDAFFRFEFSTPKQDRVWIFPDWATKKEQQNFLRVYGGRIVLAPTQANEANFREWWLEFLSQQKFQAIWLPSPFERPWSLLQLGSALYEPDIPVTAIVFDLLPLEHPRTILQVWSLQDQKEYQRRVKNLQYAHKFFAISPFVKQQLVGLLQIEARRIEVPKFGLGVEWIEVPKKLEVSPFLGAHPLVVAISGGEWRKNLPGTLRFFAQEFSGKHHLVVICHLGWRQRLRMMWLALQLGAGGRVHFVDFISEEEKWNYLFQAEVGLFLSRAEGLGIPLLEYIRAAIPRIIISKQLEENGFGKFLPSYYEVAQEKAILN